MRVDLPGDCCGHGGTHIVHLVDGRVAVKRRHSFDVRLHSPTASDLAKIYDLARTLRRQRIAEAAYRELAGRGLLYLLDAYDSDRVEGVEERAVAAR